MNFILNLPRRIKYILKKLMNIDSDPFLVEETVIRRLGLGLFKGDRECTNCEQVRSTIRLCKKCNANVCATCFVRYIVEEISFKSLCRVNHPRTIVFDTTCQNDDTSTQGTI